MHKHIVSCEWLKEHLSEVQVADCRFVLSNPTAGQAAYQEGHIPGAVYFDLEQQLSGPIRPHGGRHPLPDTEIFATQLGQAGIHNQSKVVVYDDQGGAMASRLWWMLHYLGHEQVYLLDGGFSQWVKEGYPVTSEVLAPVSTSFHPQIQDELLVEMEEVKRKRDEPGVVLVDSRENKRYRGLEEPIDPKAGHIPGAVNYFWRDNLEANGQWRNPEELKERFKKMDPSQEVIVYCGSGVTACPNIVALKEAGYKNVKLYVGSWSDWCSYQENPVAVTKE